jgi:hypothetical protein
MKTNAQDASGPYLGYMYQFLMALYLSFEKSKEDIDLIMSLENFDDISFHNVRNDPLSLIQSKFSANPGSLSDSSLEIWKTIYNWSLRENEFLKNNQVPIYILVTSSKASTKSAAYLLKNNKNRNVQEALTKLIHLF